MNMEKELPVIEKVISIAGQNKRGDYNRSVSGDMVNVHKSRATGSTIAILKGPAELGLGASSKWLGMCMTHRQFAVFETRASATNMSGHPEEWCTTCEETKRGRLQKHQPQVA